MGNIVGLIILLSITLDKTLYSQFCDQKPAMGDAFSLRDPLIFYIAQCYYFFYLILFILPQKPISVKKEGEKEVNKIISFLQILVVEIGEMSAKKKLSNGSLPTQTEHYRRFIRRNSIHILLCRSGSLKKNSCLSQELICSTPNLETCEDSPKKIQQNRTDAKIQNLFKGLGKEFETPVKRTGSMKIDHEHRLRYNGNEHGGELGRIIEGKEDQLRQLSRFTRQLEDDLREERVKRKELQEEVRCKHQEVKRLQKRVEKYKAEKEKYERERDIIIQHIQQLENLKFGSIQREIQGFRAKIMQAQVNRLRQELLKSRGEREKQLIQQIDKLIHSKYSTQNDLRSAKIANAVLLKQVENYQQQFQQIQISMHKGVTSSYEYTELRQRYRRLLLQCRELKLQLSTLQRQDNQNRQRILQSSFLTLSQSEEAIYDI